MYNFDEMLANLMRLLSIKSDEQSQVEDKPFGEGVFEALKFSLDLANSFGFKTKNYDNFVGEIIFGEGEPFAILCHLDVVPAGNLNDWKTPPFNPTIVNDRLIARGSVDDKGPFIATLYALKMLKEENLIPQKEIHLILGCNEENGWRCIEHYKKFASLPNTGFSPDACFPVIYAEKGIYHAKYRYAFDKNKLLEISGGVSANVVCDFASAKTIINEKFAKECGVEINGDTVSFKGKTAHGSTPSEGINAIYPILKYLEKVGAITENARQKLFEDCLNLQAFCDETGNLTISPNVVEIDGDSLCFTVDVRYPSTIDFSIIYEKIKLLSEIGEPQLIHHQLPLYNDKNSKLIQTLLNVYNKHTGVKAQPIAIGGGTYARAIKLGAGFGPELPDEPSPAHQPNESISLDRLKLLVEIYKDAIKELCF